DLKDHAVAFSEGDAHLSRPHRPHGGLAGSGLSVPTINIEEGAGAAVLIGCDGRVLCDMAASRIDGRCRSHRRCSIHAGV
ncbi:unnamed protein product, partial [Urochloa humidicola]